MTFDTAKRQLAAAGQSGAAFLSSSGKTLSTVAYSSPFAPVSLVPLGSSGKFDYLSRGTWTSPSMLFDTSGATIWTSPEGDGVDDSTAGYVLHKSSPQVVVAYNGGTGVSLFDGGKSAIWNEPDGDVWHVEAYHDAATASWRIISNGMNQLDVRNASGTSLSKSSMQDDFMYFSLCSWPIGTKTYNLLAATNHGIELISQTGKVVMTFKPTAATDEYRVTGCPIRLTSTKTVYLAILGAPMWVDWKRSVLWIFDASGKLVYQETFPENCGSLAVMPASSPGRPETLLVGGTSHIWAY
jgi:hypothetical protein